MAVASPCSGSAILPRHCCNKARRERTDAPKEPKGPTSRTQVGAHAGESGHNAFHRERTQLELVRNNICSAILKCHPRCFHACHPVTSRQIGHCCRHSQLKESLCPTPVTGLSNPQLHQPCKAMFSNLSQLMDIL
jgi:hypothetical protein